VRPSADVLSRPIGIGVFAFAALFGKGVEGAGEHRFEALDMGAPIDGRMLLEARMLSE